MVSIVPRHLTEIVEHMCVLVIDDDHHMRKVIRSLLLAVGVREIHDAPDGESGLRAICSVAPDAVILDWEMPDLNGAQFMRRVRAPGYFPRASVPIIMLTGHVERDRVLEAVRLGVNEFVCKPVSAKTLLDRLVAIRTNPRPMVRIGDYFGPAPRKMAPDPARLSNVERGEPAGVA